MKYRKIIELTNEEITEMLLDALSGLESVRNIQRDEKYNKIACEIHFSGENYDDGSPYYDDIIIGASFNPDGNIFTHDFSVSGEEEHKINQYLFAKGCHPLFKDNPYFKEDKR